MKTKPINIPLLGIDRSKSDIASPNGTMDEIINLRHRNGSLQPIGDYPALKTSSGNDIDFSPYSYIYLHKTSTFAHFIVVRDGKIYFLDNGVEKSITNYPDDLVLPDNISFSYNSNIIIMSYTEGDPVSNIINFYLYWNGDRYYYMNLDFDTPLVELRRIRTEKEGPQQSVYVYKEAEHDNGDIVNWEMFSKRIYEPFSADVNEAVYNLKKQGFICGNFTWMYAIRFYDGTYIKTSPLFFASQLDKKDRVYIHSYPFADNDIIEGDKDAYSFFYHLMFNLGYGGFDGASRTTIKGVLNGLELEFKFSSLSDLKNIKELILSIDIFMSTPILPINTGATDIDTIENKTFPFLKTPAEFKSEYEIKAPLYKVASFSVEYDLDLDLNTQTKPFNDFDFNNLEVQTAFVDDFDSYTKTMSDVAYLYNNKTHIASIRTQLGNVYPFILCQDQPALWQASTDPLYVYSEFPQSVINRLEIDANTRFLVRTSIKTTNGISVTLWRDGGDVIPQFLSYDNLTLNKVSALLSYPDARAYSMQIMVYNNDKAYGVEVPLRSHPLFNIAYYLSDDFRPLDFKDITNSFDIKWLLGPENNIEYRPNILKVSETDNPFTFPIEQTYAIGARQIIGLCSNTKAISTGQFGEYPLYAFCSDGIYSLGIGSGDVDYSSIKPVSRDVCNNAESITPIDDAVVFSSNRGLLMIAGDTVSEFSTPVEGIPFNLKTGYSRIELLQRALSNDNLVHLLEDVSSVDFNEYIKGADIGFIYNENREIIVSNPDYSYSYVYSLTFQVWVKRTLNTMMFINEYPLLYALSGGKLLDLTSEQNSGKKECFFLTKPIKLNGLDYVRPILAVLRSVIKPVLYSGLYVFGSVDGLTWRFIGGREYNGTVQGADKLYDFANLGCNLSREKMRYLRIAYVGNIKYDSKLDYLELHAEGKQDNSA